MDIAPDLGIYELPYLFSSLAQVDYVRSRMDAKLMERLEQKGYVGFGLAEGGFTYRPGSRWQISVNPRWNQMVNTRQYFDTI